MKTKDAIAVFGVSGQSFSKWIAKYKFGGKKELYLKKTGPFSKKYNIEIRRNPPCTPQHNGKAEKYHRTFKEELANSWEFDTSIEQLNYELSKWIHHYNYKRKHTVLGMNKMIPACTEGSI